MTFTVFCVPQKHHLCATVRPQILNFPDLRNKTPYFVLFTAQETDYCMYFC